VGSGPNILAMVGDETTRGGVVAVVENRYCCYQCSCMRRIDTDNSQGVFQGECISLHGV